VDWKNLEDAWVWEEGEGREGEEEGEAVLIDCVSVQFWMPERTVVPIPMYPPLTPHPHVNLHAALVQLNVIFRAVYYTCAWCTYTSLAGKLLSSSKELSAAKHGKWREYCMHMILLAIRMYNSK
jgi:hypothetical protein